MKDYVFAKRKHQISAWWMLLVITLCLLYVGYTEREDILQRQQIKTLQDRSRDNIMIWQMDASCASQLRNSADGILRIKTSR